MAALCCPDRAKRDVERHGVDAEPGDVFGVAPSPQPTNKARWPAILAQ
jgi:hypothetical protein